MRPASTNLTPETPNVIAGSGLWGVLQEHVDLQVALLNLRATAKAVAKEISKLIPWLTEHSVEAHMDRLWVVTQEVFTPEEIGRFSPGEAFVLGCSFYVHDLGYAFALTNEGRKLLQDSPAYKAAYERLCALHGASDRKAQQIALQLASHALHAENAERMVDDPLPGFDRYLLEPTDLRRQWSRYIGQVSASHHWSLGQVDKKMGSKGPLPDPLGGTIDLGFLAGAIRVIDCAHINSDRAPYLEQLLRGPISENSLLHWKAQEHVAGPKRQVDQLVFASNQPIKDVDAWWLFHEMASRLESEIRSVHDYLTRRKDSEGRFSLQGVKGVRTPEEFAQLVEADGFEPIDVRIHPHSIERLVELLGGRTLYGNDQFAPIRELLQNARDAILLQQAADEVAGVAPAPRAIDVSLERDSKNVLLTVADNGCGMTKRVISEYLLGIASDYWKSSDFFSDYPGVAGAGFQPAGRFGIGFLSVFMLGEQVAVHTQRQNGKRLELTLHGVGRRGALRSLDPGPAPGTKIRVRIPPEKATELTGLAEIVRAKAPMMTLPIVVHEEDRPTRIEPGWWRDRSQEELQRFAIEQPIRSTTPADRVETRLKEDDVWFPGSDLLQNRSQFKTWVGGAPEIATDTMRILALPWTSSVVLCSNGLAVAQSKTNGFVGLAEIGEVGLNVARSEPRDWDENAFRASVLGDLRPKLLAALDELEGEGRVPDRFRFLRLVGEAYGADVLAETNLPWITVLEPPGSARLLPPSEFRSTIEREPELLLAYAGNPWIATRKCLQLHPDAARKALILPIPAHGGPNASRDFGRSETVSGAFNTHFGETYGKKPSLLDATLMLIGEAWDVSAEFLKERNWRRVADDDVVCGHLVRKS